MFTGTFFLCVLLPYYIGAFACDDVTLLTHVPVDRVELGDVIPMNLNVTHVGGSAITNVQVSEIFDSNFAVHSLPVCTPSCTVTSNATAWTATFASVDNTIVFIDWELEVTGVPFLEGPPESTTSVGFVSGAGVCGSSVLSNTYETPVKHPDVTGYVKESNMWQTIDPEICPDELAIMEFTITMPHIRTSTPFVIDIPSQYYELDSVNITTIGSGLTNSALSVGDTGVTTGSEWYSHITLDFGTTFSYPDSVLSSDNTVIIEVTLYADPLLYNGTYETINDGAHLLIDQDFETYGVLEPENNFTLNTWIREPFLNYSENSHTGDAEDTFLFIVHIHPAHFSTIVYNNTFVYTVNEKILPDPNTYSSCVYDGWSEVEATSSYCTTVGGYQPYQNYTVDERVITFYVDELDIEDSFHFSYWGTLLQTVIPKESISNNVVSNYRGPFVYDSVEFDGHTYVNGSTFGHNIHGPELTLNRLHTSLPDTDNDDFAMGEEGIYEVQVWWPETTIDNAKIVIDFPPGTIYLNSTLTHIGDDIAPTSRLTEGQAQDLFWFDDEPASGTPRVTADYGDIINAWNNMVNDGDELHIEFSFRVNSALLTNERGDKPKMKATLYFDSTSCSKTKKLTLFEPMLKNTLTNNAVDYATDDGDKVTFTLKVEHDAVGDSNAFRGVTSVDMGPKLTLDPSSISINNGFMVTSSAAVASADADGFVVEFEELSHNNGEYFIVTYEAWVNSSAVLAGETLTASADTQFSSLPTSHNTLTGRVDTVTASTDFILSVPTLAIEVVSTDHADTTTPVVAIGEEIVYHATLTLPKTGSDPVVNINLDSNLDLISSRVVSIGSNIVGSDLSAEDAGTIVVADSHVRFDFGDIYVSHDNLDNDVIVVEIVTHVKDIVANDDSADANITVSADALIDGSLAVDGGETVVTTTEPIAVGTAVNSDDIHVFPDETITWEASLAVTTATASNTTFIFEVPDVMGSFVVDLLPNNDINLLSTTYNDLVGDSQTVTLTFGDVDPGQLVNVSLTATLEGDAEMADLLPASLDIEFDSHPEDPAHEREYAISKTYDSKQVGELIYDQSLVSSTLPSTGGYNFSVGEAATFELIAHVRGDGLLEVTFPSFKMLDDTVIIDVLNATVVDVGDNIVSLDAVDLSSVVGTVDGDGNVVFTFSTINNPTTAGVLGDEDAITMEVEVQILDLPSVTNIGTATSLPNAEFSTYLANETTPTSFELSLLVLEPVLSHTLVISEDIVEGGTNYTLTHTISHAPSSTASTYGVTSVIELPDLVHAVPGEGYYTISGDATQYPLTGLTTVVDELPLGKVLTIVQPVYNDEELPLDASFGFDTSASYMSHPIDPNIPDQNRDYPLLPLTNTITSPQIELDEMVLTIEAESDYERRSNTTATIGEIVLLEFTPTIPYGNVSDLTFEFDIGALNVTVGTPIVEIIVEYGDGVLATLSPVVTVSSIDPNSTLPIPAGDNVISPNNITESDPNTDTFLLDDEDYVDTLNIDFGPFTNHANGLFTPSNTPIKVSVRMAVLDREEVVEGVSIPVDATLDSEVMTAPAVFDETVAIDEPSLAVNITADFFSTIDGQFIVVIDHAGEVIPVLDVTVNEQIVGSGVYERYNETGDAFNDILDQAYLDTLGNGTFSIYVFNLKLNGSSAPGSNACVQPNVTFTGPSAEGRTPRSYVVVTEDKYCLLYPIVGASESFFESAAGISLLVFAILLCCCCCLCLLLYIRRKKKYPKKKRRNAWDWQGEVVVFDNLPFLMDLGDKEPDFGRQPTAFKEFEEENNLSPSKDKKSIRMSATPTLFNETARINPLMMIPSYNGKRKSSTLSKIGEKDYLDVSRKSTQFTEITQKSSELDRDCFSPTGNSRSSIVEANADKPHLLKEAPFNSDPELITSEELQRDAPSFGFPDNDNDVSDLYPVATKTSTTFPIDSDRPFSSQELPLPPKLSAPAVVINDEPQQPPQQSNDQLSAVSDDSNTPSALASEYPLNSAPNINFPASTPSNNGGDDVNPRNNGGKGSGNNADDKPAAISDDYNTPSALAAAPLASSAPNFNFPNNTTKNKDDSLPPPFTGGNALPPPTKTANQPSAIPDDYNAPSTLAAAPLASSAPKLLFAGDDDDNNEGKVSRKSVTTSIINSDGSTVTSTEEIHKESENHRTKSTKTTRTSTTQGENGEIVHHHHTTTVVHHYISSHSHDHSHQSDAALEQSNQQNNQQVAIPDDHHTSSPNVSENAPLLNSAPPSDFSSAREKSAKKRLKSRDIPAIYKPFFASMESVFYPTQSWDCFKGWLEDPIPVQDYMEVSGVTPY